MHFLKQTWIEVLIGLIEVVGGVLLIATFFGGIALVIFSFIGLFDGLTRREKEKLKFFWAIWLVAAIIAVTFVGTIMGH